MSGVQVLRGAAIYFGVVFGIGFVLGPFRVLLLEPRVGDRAAQLIEAPVMAAAILLAGRWVGRRFCRCGRSGSSLAVGLLAVGFALTADVGVGVLLRDMTFAEVFTNRDPVAGVVYYALLGLCAIAPWLFAARDS